MLQPARHPTAPAHAVAPRLDFLAGVDGGGSGTRVRVVAIDGTPMGEGTAGPSGLGQGVEQAWRHIDEALAAAFASAGVARPAAARVGLGLGLAGASVAAHRQAFIAADPGYGWLVLDTDAVTQLVGAHAGQPGIVVAAGTGSVGAVRHADGAVHLAGGWGFPVGDEGSGAWLGLRAMRHAQAVLDGRAGRTALSDAVLAAVAAASSVQRTGDRATEGTSPPTPAAWDGPPADSAAVKAWCARAGQHAYAQLAPLVFDASAQGDAHAEQLLARAADELARLVPALQATAPAGGAPLPVVMRGSIGERLVPRWPAALRERLIEPRGDSADGALTLLRASLARHAASTPAAR